MAITHYHESVSESVEAVARFAEKRPLVHTDVFSKSSLSAALWEHSPKERRFEGHSLSILAISLRGDSHLEQLVNGRTAWRGVAPGSVVLLHANEATDWHLDGQFEMLHIYLNDEEIPWDVKPSSLFLPFRDPILFQIGTATACAMRESGGTGGHVPYLLESMQQYLIERYFVCAESKGSTVRGGLTGFAQGKVEQYIYENLATTIPVDDLAEIVNLSTSHFARAFRDTYGMSPHQLIIQKRVDRAISLLKETDLKVDEIALQVGFSSASHLGVHFKKRLAVSPGRFRR